MRAFSAASKAKSVTELGGDVAAGVGAAADNAFDIKNYQTTRVTEVSIE